MVPLMGFEIVFVALCMGVILALVEKFFHWYSCLYTVQGAAATKRIRDRLRGCRLHCRLSALHVCPQLSPLSILLVLQR